MKLEYQVCSLESAKRLKELGVNEYSLFWWQIPTEPRYHRKIAIVHGKLKAHYGYNGYEEPVSAYTVAELGQLLPNCLIKKSGEVHWLEATWNDHGKCFLGYSCGSFPHEDVPLIGDLSEAECRAKMLIYLLENSLAQPPKITK